MVRCHVEYAVPVWFLFLEKNIDEVETVQIRATRMLAATKGLDYEDRLRLLKLYKMIHGIYDNDILPRFDLRKNVVRRNNTVRKHSKQIFITRSNKELPANFFTICAATVWNSLSGVVLQV